MKYITHAIAPAKEAIDFSFVGITAINTRNCYTIGSVDPWLHIAKIVSKVNKWTRNLTDRVIIVDCCITLSSFESGLSAQEEASYVSLTGERYYGELQIDMYHSGSHTLLFMEDDYVHLDNVLSKLEGKNIRLSITGSSMMTNPK